MRYLKSRPVDYLTIDGRFDRDILTDPLGDAAVHCLADAARVPRIETAAEFGDGPALRLRLRQLGVDVALADLLHRPEPIDALAGRALHAHGSSMRLPLAAGRLAPKRSHDAMASARARGSRRSIDQAAAGARQARRRHPARWMRADSDAARNRGKMRSKAVSHWNAKC